MPNSRDMLEASYAFCRQMSRRAGSNFHASFLLLPREKRRAMESLYAFMRQTDDLADATNARPVVASVDPRRESLAAWRAALRRVLRGESLTPEDPSSLILPSLADAVRRFHIPEQCLYAVIDGVEMDLDGRRYETFDDLQEYCQRVASAVGLACIHIWGFRGPEALGPARQAGIALQLTNILRDLKADADVGRVYLPLADLRRCDYPVASLLAGVADERFLRLMVLEIARAEQFYAEGAELIDWLDTPGRRIFGLMMSTYRSLLRQIARRPTDVFCRHVRLSGLKKLRLAARWSLMPPRKDALR
jgi:15-cis-phytoene synthase